jgi:NAD(P)-dependent dehydrogenase (short-subunit alcohol dehydrogenase family)
MKVQDRVILVTGGGSGIGRELVLQLLEKGATVAAVDIREEGLTETHRMAGPLSDRLSLHQTDISNREAVAQLAEAVIHKHGAIDGIINNAGLIHPFKPVTELAMDVIEKMINVNLYGMLNITKTFLPFLLKRPQAHITNISSMGGLFAFPGQAFYGASKAAVKVVTEGLYVELRDTNVGVSVVFPGAVDTGIVKNSGADSAALEKAANRFRSSSTSPRTAATRIIRAMENSQFRVVIGIDASILSVLYRIAPRLTMLMIAAVMKILLKDEPR